MNKELELEAMDMLKKKWEHLYSFGYPKKPFPTNYENDLNNVMLGLTSKYVKKQKLEFAIRELMWVNILIPFEHQYSKDCIYNKIKELEQQLSEL